MLICHLAVLIILCGAAITALYKKVGSLDFSINQVRSGYRNAAGTYNRLGFDVKLDDFTIDNYEKKNWKGLIKGFKSTVSIMENGRVTLRENIEVNRPLSYGGYTFYQAGYNPEQPGWTNLMVVKDPGAGTVFFGLGLLNAGVLITVFKKRRQEKNVLVTL